MKILTKDKQFYKNFFSLWYVLVLNNIIVLSVGLADNIMLGAYSESALSGAAACNQIQFIFQQITVGLGSAMVVLGSQYWGQKRGSFGGRNAVCCDIIYFCRGNAKRGCGNFHGLG